MSIPLVLGAWVLHQVGQQLGHAVLLNAFPDQHHHIASRARLMADVLPLDAQPPLAMLSTHARHSSGFATGNTVTAKVSMFAPPSEARPGVRFSPADRAVSIRSSAAASLWGWP